MQRSFRAALVFLILFSASSSPSFGYGLEPTAETSPYERQASGLTNVQPRLCNLTQGRSAFFLLPSRAYALSAIGFYFKYFDSADFSPLKVSVFLAKGYTTEPDFSTPIAEGLTNPEKISVVYESGQPWAYEVLFPLRKEVSLANGKRLVFLVECLTSSQNFLIFERPSGWGQYNFIDSSTSPPTRKESGERLAFTLFSGRPETPAQPPAVFIHEAGGQTSDWDDILNFVNLQADYVGQLEMDEEKTIAENAKALKELITELSTKYWNAWGDGKVDLVGYGLGGLVAQHYLLENAGQSKIRRFIAVSTPFKGAPWLDFDRRLKAEPRSGRWLKKKFSEGVKALLGARQEDFKTNGAAFSQMATSSSYIKNLDPSPLPNDVEYFSLYGNIAAEYRQNLFGLTIKRKESLGDLFVPAASAAGLDVSRLTRIAFEDEGGFQAKIAVGNEGATVEFEGPELENLRYYHSNLLSQPAVKSKIKELLTQAE